MGKLRLREGAQNYLYGLVPETVLQLCFLGVGERSQPGERTQALWWGRDTWGPQELREVAQAQGGGREASPECGVWFLVEIPASELQVCLGQAPLLS